MRPPDFWTRTDLPSRLSVAALTPLGSLYGASVALRARFANPLRTRARIVCVGNLTAGGTGKTPVAVAIATELRARGSNVWFLSRGYGGRLRGPVVVEIGRHAATETGDEPLLLARAAPTVVSRDRRAGAVLAEQHGAEIIVMDDGHQNFELAKDLSLVVIDARKPFGNGRMLPAGPMREPARQGLARADAVALIGDGSLGVSDVPVPVLRARIVPYTTRDYHGLRVIAFAGIGQPDKFFDTLKALGATPVETRVFDDHHVFTEGEVADLKAVARSNDAMLVTTEKDFVRLTREQQQGVDMLPVQAVFESTTELRQLLDRFKLSSAARA
jgi:tetraacyldisaccharide 4'-kinase